MSLDQAAIGRRFAPVALLVTRSRLRNFAAATGQADPIYIDVNAAEQAGHRDLPVPPTFMFGIELEAPNPFGYLTDLGVDLRTVLHGEQRFDYHQIAHAGDELTAVSRIDDIYSKRNGLLDFIVKSTIVTDQDDTRVATLSSTTVVQNKHGKDER
ncbi:MaoC family dehydratase N-terminal domain-containing protein [Gordonia rubripertincta]|uniref:MaoC family dehydratase N-terminal domain-containing protein n=1 Tax=Gordonia rubripertincta TaxID=36822 RepID=A0AAW4FZ20_GORRU|nr:MaoC family dehydratase N-terminal domain-containing protein [Gordonia rubripertincta]MBM7276368.1 MaoC family dehydratase N-terminal domain-containing protein [Gordonia rubripertincta]